MAKTEKTEKVIESVEFKDPKDPGIQTRNGMNVTTENLTVERYEQLISLSDTFKEKFIVKYTNKPKENEQISEEGKGS